MNPKAIKNKIFNGKNPKFIYYTRAIAMMCIPRLLLSLKLKDIDNILEPESVIRISLCRTAKRNPLIFPI